MQVYCPNEFKHVLASRSSLHPQFISLATSPDRDLYDKKMHLGNWYIQSIIYFASYVFVLEAHGEFIGFRYSILPLSTWMDTGWSLIGTQEEYRYLN